MKLYLDGVEVASGSHAVGGALDTNASVPVAIGANGTAERFFNGILDDVAFYDYALPAGEIADLYAANPPAGCGELYRDVSALERDRRTIPGRPSTSALIGVPANAVVEVAVINSDTGKEYFGGVRAVGSSLERRFRCTRPKVAGWTRSRCTYRPTPAARFSITPIKAPGQFRPARLLDGCDLRRTLRRLQGGCECELAIPRSRRLRCRRESGRRNRDVANQHLDRVAGRPAAYRIQPGSGKLTLHETEGGGVDMVSMLVASDASSMVEVYAEADSVVDFHLLGYWSTPPGTYTETGGVQGQALTAADLGNKRSQWLRGARRIRLPSL